MRIYYHQGECITVHSRDTGRWIGDEGDDIFEMLSRLETVSPGSKAEECLIKRNAIGQLGFHVQPEGVVTDVEAHGCAAVAGLKKGSRLVEVLKKYKV